MTDAKDGFQVLLESRPPVSKAGATARRVSGACFLKIPSLTLDCEYCGGDRNFRVQGTDEIQMHLPPNGNAPMRWHIFHFTCRNCGWWPKHFAIELSIGAIELSIGSYTVSRNDSVDVQVIKFGEYPAFGTKVPSKVNKLFGEDRDLFFKGRRCEDQGLGVGAFAYYRRVIENQKSRLLEEILRVAKKIGADPAQIATLDSAKSEQQFRKAVEQVKNAIPESLKIGNHNPLTLLHSALSEGMHAETDEECLAYANSIRCILFDFVERADQVLKEKNELDTAVSRLLNKNTS